MSPMYFINMALQYLLSYVPSLPFGNKNEPHTDPVPLERPENAIELSIDTEYLTGSHFASYKSHSLYNSYARQYYTNHNMLSFYFESKSLNPGFTKSRTLDYKYLSQAYKDIYDNYRLENDKSPKLILPFHNFDKLTGIMMKRLFSHFKNVVEEKHSAHFKAIMESINDFFETKDKPNMEHVQPWLSVSRHFHDLLSILVFIKDTHQVDTNVFIVSICKHMAGVELFAERAVNSLNYSSDSTKSEDDKIETHTRLEAIARNIDRDLDCFIAKVNEKMNSKCENDLSVILACNRYNCLINILLAAATSDSKLKNSCILISKNFLSYATSAFIHVLLSYLDLRRSMYKPLGKYVVESLKSTGELGKMVQNAIKTSIGISNSNMKIQTPSSFDPTELALPSSINNFVMDLFLRPTMDRLEEIQRIRLDINFQPSRYHYNFVCEVGKFYTKLLYPEKDVSDADKVITSIIKRLLNHQQIHKIFSFEVARMFVNKLLTDFEMLKTRLQFFANMKSINVDEWQMWATTINETKDKQSKKEESEYVSETFDSCENSNGPDTNERQVKFAKLDGLRFETNILKGLGVILLVGIGFGLYKLRDIQNKMQVLDSSV